MAADAGFRQVVSWLPSGCCGTGGSVPTVTGVREVPGHKITESNFGG